MPTAHPLKDPRNVSAPWAQSKSLTYRTRSQLNDGCFNCRVRGAGICALMSLPRERTWQGVWTSTVLRQGLAWLGLATAPTSSPSAVPRPWGSGRAYLGASVSSVHTHAHAHLHPTESCFHTPGYTPLFLRYSVHLSPRGYLPRVTSAR